MGQWAAMRSDEHEQAGKQGVADILYLPLGFPSPCPLCYLPRLPLHLYHCWLQHSSQLPLVHQLPPLAPLYWLTRRLELQPPSWAAMCFKIPAPLTDTSLHAQTCMHREEGHPPHCTWLLVSPTTQLSLQSTPEFGTSPQTGE